MAIQTFITRVRSGLRLLPQPDARTCQSACIAMATDRQDTVIQVRAELERLGTPGDPFVMGKILKRECGDRYKFYDNANLNDVREWLKEGGLVITHGFFTDGHVICLRGVEIDSSRLSYRFLVSDPWSEFNFKTWAYNFDSVGYQGVYSSHGIYAACVAGTSKRHAAQIYRRGELDSSRRGAWIHLIRAS